MDWRILFIVPLLTTLAHAGVDAIPIKPSQEPLVVTKVRVVDCRAVRGFVGAPVDGSPKSGSWDGKMWEYPMGYGGVGVEYVYRNADGLHITFADDRGFNAVIVRGGIKAELLRDVQKYDQPESGTLVHNFPGGTKTSRAWFDQPVKTRKVSFFNVSDGVIADASFFRVRREFGALKTTHAPKMIEAGGKAISIPIVLDRDEAITAVGVKFDARGMGDKPFTVSVSDPLNPRLMLHSADYVVTGDGEVNLVLDFPDQVMTTGGTMTIALEFDEPAKLQLVVEVYGTSKDTALAEALEHRKFILHALYTPVSEARPWNIWNNPTDDSRYFTQPDDTGDVLQDRLRPWVREIVMTLHQCRALDPEGKDPVVRQMYEWIYRKILTKTKDGLPPFPTKFAKIDGVPEWAALVHQAWMQAREVPKWWIENRMAPNGEFGGLLADDTDMYQNYAPFPMLERDGVGGMLLDAGARMAELLDQKLLKDGINKESMDPLHAYEEGMNHEALMAYWNYGDPIYMERCMAAARSTQPLTMVTTKGHRHFISNILGWDQIKKPEPPEREHGSHTLMWHPTFITAWYNRHPDAMKWLTEWGDGWLEHMKPGDHGYEVKLPEDETRRSDPQPFTGGWGMTGSVFTWLADLTGEARFIRPYDEYFRSERKNTGVHFAEIEQLGMTSAAIDDPPWNSVLYASGDKRPFIEAIRKDIEELQRFPHMYTTVECFTDRVFLYAMINPSIAYTGGYTTRNKLNLTYAVSWDGFGTDYAALVTSATSKHLKVLLCNISDQPLAGLARLWRLDPGEYNLRFGPDANEDDEIDRVEPHESLTITRGDEVAIKLPPKVVHVLELKQTRKLEPIFNRADLAIAQRELKIEGGKVTGVVHNIGTRDADEVEIALLDDQGNTIDSKKLGRLAAPLDLHPKTVPFEFTLPADVEGWSIVVDPGDLVPEIYQGNNKAPLTRASH